MNIYDDNWKQFGEAVIRDPRRARRGFVRYSIIVALLGVAIGVSFTMAVML